MTIGTTKGIIWGIAGAFALSLSAAAVAQTNPPGTAAERTLDRAAGTNTSGAYPAQSDGTRANPPGTAASRALDRAAGTNTSGAYPSQSDGTAQNPKGTAASRTANDAKHKTTNTVR